MRERVSAIIEGAAFTADEFDTATSGECATFALALFSALQTHSIPCRLALIIEEKDGQPRRTRDGGLVWRHAVVLVEDRIFDMRGEQEFQWMADEFVWNTTNDPGIIALEPVEFFIQLQNVYGSGIPAFDEEYFQDWKKRLDCVDVALPCVNLS